MQKILCIFPTTFEAKKVFSLYKKFSDNPVKLKVGSHFDISTKKICCESEKDKTFRFFVSGIGCQASIKRTTDIAKEFQPTLVILMGFAGACKGNVKIADFIFSSNSTSATRVFREIGARESKIFTAKNVVHSEGKTKLAKAGYDAVEMENDIFKDAISAFCPQAEFAQLRCISDALEGDPPQGFDSNPETGELVFHFGVLLLSLIKKPANITSLINFFANSSKAMSRYNAKIPELLMKLAKEND